MSEYYFGGRDNLDAADWLVRYNSDISLLIRNAIGDAKRVLDFGAGRGRFASKVMSWRKDVQVDCVEPDVRYAAELSKEFTTFGSLESVSETSYDAAYSINSLEHIENDAETLKMLNRKLVPGGVFFVFVPAFQVLFSQMDIQVGHQRRYSRNGLVRLLETAGFGIREVNYFDCMGFFVSLAYNLVPKRTGSVSCRAMRFYDRFVYPSSRLLDRMSRKFLGKNLFCIACS